jgi:hypothetical protein
MEIDFRIHTQKSDSSSVKTCIMQDVTLKSEYRLAVVYHSSKHNHSFIRSFVRAVCEQNCHYITERVSSSDSSSHLYFADTYVDCCQCTGNRVRYFLSEKFWNIALKPNVVAEWSTSCFVFGRSWVQISAWRPIPTKIFVVFLSPSRQMPGWQYTLKLGHYRFLLHPFQFIIYLLYIRFTLYSPSYWESVVK